MSRCACSACISSSFAANSENWKYWYRYTHIHTWTTIACFWGSVHQSIFLRCGRHTQTFVFEYITAVVVNFWVDPSYVHVLFLQQSTGVCEHVLVWCRLSACAVLTRVKDPSREVLKKKALVNPNFYKAAYNNYFLLWHDVTGSACECILQCKSGKCYLPAKQFIATGSLIESCHGAV